MLKYAVASAEVILLDKGCTSNILLGGCAFIGCSGIFENSQSEAGFCIDWIKSPQFYPSSYSVLPCFVLPMILPIAVIFLTNMPDEKEEILKPKISFAPPP